MHLRQKATFNILIYVDIKYVYWCNIHIYNFWHFKTPQHCVVKNSFNQLKRLNSNYIGESATIMQNKTSKMKSKLF